MSLFYIGVDLGQAQDPSAMVTIEELEDSNNRTEYHVRDIERFKLGALYTEIARRVSDRMHMKPLRENSILLVDSTGIGRPVLDLFEEMELHPIGITFTGGNTVSKEGRHYTVPKRDLVGQLLVLFQSRKIKIAKGLGRAQTLINELQNLRVKITSNANDTYQHREGEHDDLVFATAIACWYAERVGYVAPRVTFLG